jgi:uncharacterized membrane protein
MKRSLQTLRERRRRYLRLVPPFAFGLAAALFAVTIWVAGSQGVVLQVLVGVIPGLVITGYFAWLHTPESPRTPDKGGDE